MIVQPNLGRALVFGLSCALALYLTPLVRRGAQARGILDEPKGPLKTHHAPVAYLGGIAIFLAFVLALSVVLTLDVTLLAILFTGTLMTLLGLFDDLHVLPPSCKLLGQLLATWVLFRCGLHIQLSFLPPWAAVGLTVLWLVGVTNALNIVDVSDGLASGCAAVAALALATMAGLNSNTTLSLAALALAGALVGYLPFSWAPASIYLGDTGSLFVGFTLAALSLVVAYTEKSVWGALAPVAFLVVPLLDMTLVCAARLRRGHSPLLGSADHLALRLKAAGWSSRQVACFGIGLSAVGGLVGIGLTRLDKTQAATLAIAGTVAFFSLVVWLWHQPPCEAPTPRP